MNLKQYEKQESKKARKKISTRSFIVLHRTSCFVSCLDSMFQYKLLDLKSETFLNGPLKNPLEVGHLRLYLLDLTSNNFMQHATEIAMLPEWHHHGLALNTSEPGYTGIQSATSHHSALPT